MFSKTILGLTLRLASRQGTTKTPLGVNVWAGNHKSGVCHSHESVLFVFVSKRVGSFKVVGAKTPDFHVLARQLRVLIKVETINALCFIPSHGFLGILSTIFLFISRYNCMAQSRTHYPSFYGILS